MVALALRELHDLAGRRRGASRDDARPEVARLARAPWGEAR